MAFAEQTLFPNFAYDPQIYLLPALRYQYLFPHFPHKIKSVKRCKALKDEEILVMLREYSETNKLSYTTLKTCNPCLFYNIYDKINDNGIPKGCQRLYYYLDILYGDENDYSKLLKKCHIEYYWTDKRICKIIKSYIEVNRDLYGFIINNSRVIQIINRKHQNVGINYYLQLIGLNADSDICNSYKNGFWTIEQTIKKAKEIYEKYGYLSRHIWKESGYPETPLNRYSLTKIKNDLGYCTSLKAKDGKIYRSFREVFVANLFWYMDLDYISDRLIDPSYCRALRYDFYLIAYDCYVEIWGYNNNNIQYTSNKEEKIKLYKNNGFKLVEIKFELFHSYNPLLNIALDIIKKLEAQGVVIKNNEFVLEDILKETSDDIEKIKMNLLNSLTPYIHDKKYLPSEEELKHAKDTLIIDIKRLGGFKKTAIFLNLLPKFKMKRINKI